MNNVLARLSLVSCLMAATVSVPAQAQPSALSQETQPSATNQAVVLPTITISATALNPEPQSTQRHYGFVGKRNKAGWHRRNSRFPGGCAELDCFDATIRARQVFRPGTAGK